MYITHTTTTVDCLDTNGFILVKEDLENGSRILCTIKIGNIKYKFYKDRLIDINREGDIVSSINLDEAKQTYKTIIKNFDNGSYLREYCTYFDDGSYEYTSNKVVHVSKPTGNPGESIVETFDIKD
jgi:hypothetical protein